ncbi:GDSL esterase/lipase [Acorus calamus]|uniref:GDSL esterase/lipase n=1 Tax=Acorus calamus TaxID=4465 RepID=A0AAV9EEQ5_ACOCL|nr:GDSL esterase/lipase [Acorus calamus]
MGFPGSKRKLTPRSAIPLATVVNDGRQRFRQVYQPSSPGLRATTLHHRRQSASRPGHSMCHATPSNATKFPAALIFGDSTVDSGNNDYTATLVKANHSPYDMNSPGGQLTGRFSNGMFMPDFLTSSLGLKESIPPFLDPELSDEDVKMGVNFVSTGSRFDDLTTTISGAILRCSSRTSIGSRTWWGSRRPQASLTTR